MKKTILIAVLLFGTCFQIYAQSKTKHLMISIIESIGNQGKSPNVFITQDDSAQVQKKVEFNLHVKLKDEIASHENQIMQILTPYYNAGWKLVTTSSTKVEGTIFAITRFFFTKDQ